MHIAFEIGSIVDTVLLVLLLMMAALQMMRAAMRRIREGVGVVESGLGTIWVICLGEVHGGKNDKEREHGTCLRWRCCWLGLQKRMGKLVGM